MSEIVQNAQGLRCLNAGCGHHYLSDWTNLDFFSNKHVRFWDLRRPLPFDEEVFDVVYSSNAIEHLVRTGGEALLRELVRVLQPGGTLRLLTPDLEQMCGEYIRNLEQWLADPSERNRHRYNWILLEMFDQMTRQQSRGMMGQVLDSGDIDEDYVLARTGDEFVPLLCAGRAPPDTACRRQPCRGAMERLRAAAGWRWRSLRDAVRRLRRGADRRRPPGPGELHRWYYDRASLRCLAESAGLIDFAVVDYRTSRISGWNNMNLDRSDYGDRARKPDSIIVEATKPIGRD